MTLLSDRIISDSGLELARVFEDARFDVDDLLDRESARPAGRQSAFVESMDLQ